MCSYAPGSVVVLTCMCNKPNWNLAMRYSAAPNGHCKDALALFQRILTPKDMKWNETTFGLD